MQRLALRPRVSQRAFATNSAMTAVSILFCTLLRLCLKRNNAQLDREEAEASIVKDVGEDETTDGFSESLATCSELAHSHRLSRLFQSSSKRAVPFGRTLTPFGCSPL